MKKLRRHSSPIIAHGKQSVTSSLDHTLSSMTEKSSPRDDAISTICCGFSAALILACKAVSLPSRLQNSRSAGGGLLDPGEGDLLNEDALNKVLFISIGTYSPANLPHCRIAALTSLPYWFFRALQIYMFEVTCFRCLEFILFRLFLCSRGLRFSQASAFLGTFDL